MTWYHGDKIKIDWAANYEIRKKKKWINSHALCILVSHLAYYHILGFLEGGGEDLSSFFLGVFWENHDRKVFWLLDTSLLEMVTDIHKKRQ